MRGLKIFLKKEDIIKHIRFNPTVKDEIQRYKYASLSIEPEIP